MADETPDTIPDLASAETVFSQDDWRPGEISRGAVPATLEIGDVLFGAYEIEAKLGEGGMGAVYRARHLSLDSPRAIKMMNANLSGDPDAVERFHREAKALLEVHHPAVVRCHDLLRDDHGRIFVVMELIEGVPLSDRMSERPLSAEEIRALAKRIGGGLEAAHAQGVIHRDIAPDNIMLPGGRAEHAKLVDFGIAKVLKAGEQTINAGFKGKIAYASPEQLGLHDGNVGPASDFFGLGLVLCAAALGERIDMGRNFASAVDARRKPIAIPTAVPAALRGDIAKLLALDPAKRPLSIAGLFEDVSDRPARRWKRPALGIGLAAGVLLGIAIGVGGLRPATPVIDDGIEATPMREDEVGVSAAIVDEVSETGDVVPTEPIDEAPEIALEPMIPDPSALFEGVRTRLVDLEARSDGIGARFAITPNPVAAESTYVLELESDCDCHPLVFLIGSEEQRIDLLYPNPLEEPRSLHPGEVFTIPSSEDLYTLTAMAGSGADRIKVLVLEQPPDFPGALAPPPPGSDSVEALIDMLGPEDVEFWSASPEQPERLAQLASLLDGLEPGAWSSAEQMLSVVPAEPDP